MNIINLSILPTQERKRLVVIQIKDSKSRFIAHLPFIDETAYDNGKVKGFKEMALEMIKPNYPETKVLFDDFLVFKEQKERINANIFKFKQDIIFTWFPNIDNPFANYTNYNAFDLKLNIFFPNKLTLPKQPAYFTDKYRDEYDLRRTLENVDLFI